MEFNIRGTTMQVVDIQLNESESVFTAAGGMSWMSSNIKMETDSKGGLFKGIGRSMSGESFFMNIYTCEQGTGVISFAADAPGKVIPMRLEQGKSIICQQGTFLAGEYSVSIQVHFTKRLGAGFFGGEGFILQKISGPGQVFLEICGEITEYELQEGQVLKVDPGHIGAFEESVTYDITTVSGLKNKLFGGEGFFLATVQGPGKVWLQSMPMDKLAKRIAKSLPSKRRRS